eukprot:Nitzschia sp. Nitz4//scaffold112_size70979//42712//43084//NITZ4_005905-RA/size70979-augustus-gene-0.93-mRNA-1//-1//CDS//3329533274//9304//frame0
MGFTTAVIGGAVGFTAQCMSNSIQKIPISRQPWMHVLCTLGGAWAANKWVKVETSMLADVNEIRAAKGLPPMVGSHHYFPLVPPSFDTKP